MFWKVYRMLRKRGYSLYIIAVVLLIICYLCGHFDHIRETSFQHFTYPLEENVLSYVEDMRKGLPTPRPAINQYNYNYIINPIHTCPKEVKLQIVLVVKSSLDHFERREVIRRTWGDVNRFPDAKIRIFFMLGIRRSADIQEKIYLESKKYSDLIQVDFLDSYYNNTIKTMTSYKWLLKNCRNSQFYMFVDDDYYVSTKNVLNYIANPTDYPELVNNRKENLDGVDINRFYSGHCVPARPMRDFFSKYKLSLNEYPFDKFPLYSTAGAYILSAGALQDIYHASYFTKHFRFDDVYLGIICQKLNIKPYHSKYIASNWDNKDEDFQKFCVASHGFEDSAKMSKLWTQQKSLGYA